MERHVLSKKVQYPNSDRIYSYDNSIYSVATWHEDADGMELPAPLRIKLTSYLKRMGEVELMHSNTFHSAITTNIEFLPNRNLFLIGSLSDKNSEIPEIGLSPIEQNINSKQLELPDKYRVKNDEGFAHWAMVSATTLNVIHRWSSDHNLIPMSYESATNTLAVVKSSNHLPSNKKYRCNILFYKIVFK